MSGKILSELLVADLKMELETRGLDKTGVKAVLLERLSKALVTEGRNIETYRFGVDGKTEVAAEDSITNGCKDDTEQHSEVITIDEDEEGFAVGEDDDSEGAILLEPDDCSNQSVEAKKADEAAAVTQEEQEESEAAVPPVEMETDAIQQQETAAIISETADSPTIPLSEENRTNLDESATKGDDKDLNMEEAESQQLLHDGEGDDGEGFEVDMSIEAAAAAAAGEAKEEICEASPTTRIVKANKITISNIAASTTNSASTTDNDEEKKKKSDKSDEIDIQIVCDDDDLGAAAPEEKKESYLLMKRFDLIGVEVNSNVIPLISPLIAAVVPYIDHPKSGGQCKTD